MKRLLFDIEANGLLETVHTIWCVSTINLDTHERVFFGPNRIQEALAYLSTATLLVGHNIIGYDIPALVKVTGWKPTCDIKDTLVMCQMIFADQSTDDRKHPDKRIQSLDGSHSLEAWGLRLNCRKQDYKGGFDSYSEEMGLYCQQDTLTNEVIYRHCEKQTYSEEALALEQFIAHIYAGMERVGFGFDKEKALALQATLDEKLVSLESEVAPYIVLGKEETNTPAYWEMTWPDGTTQQFETKTESEIVRKKLGHKPKQCVLTRGPNKCKSVNPYAGPSAKYKPFNPGSGSQVRNYLHAAHGWLSPRLTPKGQRLSDAGGDYNILAKEYGQTSEEILRTLQWPEAKLFADAAMVKKVRSMVATGQQGWLKKVSPVDGRIHARFIGCSCVTHRSACAGPNLQQVPHVALDKDKKPLFGFEGRYGADCRELFLPLPNQIQVGTDLSGIEARKLAHFLFYYDKGAYVQQILTGDIHALNCGAIKDYAKYTIGRNESKTPYYGFLYGIGPEKQGRQVCSVCDDAMQEFRERERYYTRKPEKITRKRRVKGHTVAYRPAEMAFADVGEKVNRAFSKGIDGMEGLLRDVQAASEKGYLNVLDRQLIVRKKHSALNTLLQGGAAIVMKRWVVSLYKTINTEGIKATLMGAIHDELQASVESDHVEIYSEAALNCIKYAGEYYKLNIPLAGEVKVGNNWCECH